MQLRHDPEADAVYIQLRLARYDHSKDLDDSRRIDYDTDGDPIGVELLNVSLGVNLRDLPEAEAIGQLLEQRHFKVLV